MLSLLAKTGILLGRSYGRSGEIDEILPVIYAISAEDLYEPNRKSDGNDNESTKTKSVGVVSFQLCIG